jgi:hypothetical protein
MREVIGLLLHLSHVRLMADARRHGRMLSDDRRRYKYSGERGRHRERNPDS